MEETTGHKERLSFIVPKDQRDLEAYGGIDRMKESEEVKNATKEEAEVIIDDDSASGHQSDEDNSMH